MEMETSEGGRHKRLRRCHLLVVGLQLHEGELVPELWLRQLGLLEPLRLELFRWFGMP